jgi:hypothetical protein
MTWMVMVLVLEKERWAELKPGKERGRKNNYFIVEPVLIFRTRRGMIFIWTPKVPEVAVGMI